MGKIGQLRVPFDWIHPIYLAASNDLVEKIAHLKDFPAWTEWQRDASRRAAGWCVHTWLGLVVPHHLLSQRKPDRRNNKVICTFGYTFKALLFIINNVSKTYVEDEKQSKETDVKSCPARDTAWGVCLGCVTCVVCQAGATIGHPWGSIRALGNDYQCGYERASGSGNNWNACRRSNMSLAGEVVSVTAFVCMNLRILELSPVLPITRVTSFYSIKWDWKNVTHLS